MTTFDRAYGVTGYVMDRAKLAKAIAEVRSAQIGREVTADEIHVLPCIMLKRGKHLQYSLGTTAIVNSEGVGDHNNEDSDIKVYFTFGINGGIIWDIALDADYTRSMATDEEVELADFIRNHNDRLQTNFGIWDRWAREFDKELV